MDEQVPLTTSNHRGDPNSTDPLTSSERRPQQRSSPLIEQVQLEVSERRKRRNVFSVATICNERRLELCTSREPASSIHFLREREGSDATERKIPRKSKFYASKCD